MSPNLILTFGDNYSIQIGFVKSKQWDSAG